ncbi:MAG: DUF333 domain-containing protein [Candidatus Pacearchaeota archaeon]|nr:DUF333 domain-containing protein [Candidatus Pacearchaeota archaeon]
MKKFLVLFFVVFLIFLMNYVSALPNPAAVYCTELGYEHKIEDTPFGEKGICILPNKEECEEWAFLQGRCGKKYSYCARQGYEMKIENGRVFCVVPYGKNRNKEIPLDELLDLTKSSKCPYVEIRGIKRESEELLEENRKEYIINEKNFEKISIKTYNASNFHYWDWRDPPNGTIYSKYNSTFFDDNFGWLTSVKDQGNCGSCWAFSTIASLEAKYEILQKNSRLNPDLSEQREVSCDRTCYPPPNNDSCNSGCAGGYMDLALKYIIDNGSVDENCFPYISFNGSNGSCDYICSDYNNRLWKINNYSVLWPSRLTNDQLKQLLINQGPLIIAVVATYYWYNYSNTSDKIFTDNTCDNSSINWSYLNHGVLLVGYNDTGNINTSYWIIKNSWGIGWGKDGYIYIRFNCSGIGLEVEYPHNVIAPTDFKPIIFLNSPQHNYTTKDSLITFNFTTWNRNATNAICDLIVNDTIVNTTIAANNTTTIMTYNLSEEGIYNWKIRCWEQDLGIVNTSATRTLTYTLGKPKVTLNEPKDNFVSNSQKINLSCTAHDDYNLTKVTLYGNWSGGWHASETNPTPINATPVIFEKVLGPGTYIWNCEACDNENNCVLALQNRTFVIPNGCVAESGTIYTCGSIIKESCSLDGNLRSNTTCFTLGSNNITINGNGFSITRDGGKFADGINTSGKGNITISNLTISNFSRGIYIYDLQDTDTINISSCNIENNTQQDIEFNSLSESDCDRIFIENVTGSNGNRIAFYNTSVTLKNEIFSQLFLCNADNSSLSNVTISGSEKLQNNGLFVYFTNSSNFSLVNSSNNYIGLSIVSSENNTITNSIFDSNELGIFLAESKNNYIISITAKNNYLAFFSQSNSVNNLVSYFDIDLQETISFVSKDVILNKTSKPALDPRNCKNIGKFVNVTATDQSSWIYLNISYNENNISGNEADLTMFVYDRSYRSWKELPDAGVNTTSNYVYSGNVTSYGVFAPMLRSKGGAGSGGGGGGGGGMTSIKNQTNQTNVTIPKPETPVTQEKIEERLGETEEKQEIKKKLPSSIVFLFLVFVAVLVFVIFLFRKKKNRKFFKL